METNANQKVSCVANYAYDASEPDELTVRPGDVLRDVDRLPGGWWRGELRGRRGMFPDNFVSVVSDQTPTRSGGIQGRCRAVFSYQPANSDELPLCVGDVLEVLGEVEEGWWQGRRQGRVGVFPSNFVVMLDPPQPAPPFEPAPALPPKPVKEFCRVLYPYSAVNDDELSLSEGDVVTIVSKDAPDRGWWRGELNGHVGLFPDNFVQLLAPGAPELEEKKPDRPPTKTTNAIYPVLNKYSEKTSSVKELTTSKISLHKDNTVSKESSTQSTVTHTNKNESEKLIHNETVNDGSLEGQVKKPPVPLKKSPTPSAGVGGLFSGLKSKIIPSTDKEKSSSTTLSSGSSSGGEYDRTDGLAASKTNANANTFDHVERNSILNDPRAGRVKAPRRRPPSQALREDTLQQIGLSNGHEVKLESSEKPLPDKAEEIKPRAREWEKHKAPWMAELKLNQAKKTVHADKREPLGSKPGTGSTDRILDIGLEEKRSHSMEMSKSTSSISSRMSILESFEETTKVRHSLDSKKETRDETPRPATLHSPTAAGRTLMTMLDEIKKPLAPPPPVAPARPPVDLTDKTPSTRTEKTALATEKTALASEKTALTTEKTALTTERTALASEKTEHVIRSSAMLEKANILERIDKVEEKVDKRDRPSADRSEVKSNTLERRLHSLKVDKVERNDVSAKHEKLEGKEKSEGADALIAQLNSRISNLEKLIEVQNSMFSAALEDLTAKLKAESEKRQALQSEMEKLAHCVTQV